MKKIIALGLMALGLSVGIANATITKPVKMFVAAPVGSAPDVISRKFAERMESRLSQPVVVINRPGANGAIALQEFNNETDRDHVIYFGDMQSVMIHPILSGQEKLVENVKHVSPLLKADFVLAVSPKIKDFDQLTALIAQGKVSYGSWGVGSPPHVMGEELAQLYKDTQAVHVPYKDYSQWFIDISAQNLTYSFVSVGSTLALEQKGALKYIAITSPQRNAKFANVPTLSELTKNKVETYQAWATVAIHRQTSPTNEAILRAAIREVLASQELQPTFNMLNLLPWTATATELDAFIAKDSAKYRAAYKKYNINN
jgi:tripartite-type tricarboxylate transporter receptor subunit TctC